MAHQENQHGIDSITPRTGLPTGLGILAVFAGAVWLCVKHPSTARRALLFLPVMAIATLGDPMAHPVPAMIVAFFIIRSVVNAES